MAFDDEEKPLQIALSERQQSWIRRTIVKGRLAIAAAAFAAIGSTALGYKSIGSYPTEESARFKETAADLRGRHPELNSDKIPYFGETDQIDEVIDRALKAKKDAPEFNRILRRHDGGGGAAEKKIDTYTLERQNTEFVRFLVSNPPLVDELARNDQLRKELFDFMEMEINLNTHKQLFYGKMGLLFLLFPALAISGIARLLRKARTLKAQLEYARSQNQWVKVESILEQLKTLNLTIDSHKAITASLEAQKSALIGKLDEYKIKETTEVAVGEVFRADSRRMRLAEISQRLRVAVDNGDVEALEVLMIEAQELDGIVPEEKKKAMA